MNPTNAFAQPRHALPDDHILRDMPNETSSKRRKLKQEPQISLREADSVTALETDYMIVDYLAYQCATGRLRLDAQAQPQNNLLRTNQQLLDTFLPIFKARHPHFHPDPQLRVRLGLLRFASLYTTRLKCSHETPSPRALESLRSTNQQRAVSWIRDSTRIPSSASTSMRTSYDTELPIPISHLLRNRSRILLSIFGVKADARKENTFYGSSSSVSLLDLLPSFMEVSAAINAMFNGASSEIWMRLAAEFIMQACLEQYLIYGASGTDAIDEAFAHGYQPDLGTNGISSEPDKLTDASDGIDAEHEINAMFEHPDYGIETPSWTKLRRSFLMELLTPEPASLVAKLERIAHDHPLKGFHDELMEFLDGILKAIPRPALVQLETGKLDGLTPQETMALIDRCGVAREVYGHD